MPAIRVATYNISGGVTADKRFYSKRGNVKTEARLEQARNTIEGVAQLLKEEEIEIAALQEVDTCYSGAQVFDQGQVLARQLGAELASLPLFEYHLAGLANVRTGLATLSTAPLVRRKPIALAQREVSWKRKLKAQLLGAKGALHTVHEVEGTQLHVVNAHLTHDVDAQKEFELSALLDYCSKLDPVLLLGDLNTSPLPTRSPAMVERHHFGSDGCMKILAAHIKAHPGVVHADARLGSFSASADDLLDICTYPSGKESIKLDYCIGFSSKASFEMSPETVLSSPLSNHSATSVRVSW